MAGNHISNLGSEGLRPTEVYTEAGNRERQTEKQERERDRGEGVHTLSMATVQMGRVSECLPVEAKPEGSGRYAHPVCLELGPNFLSLNFLQIYAARPPGGKNS